MEKNLQFKIYLKTTKTKNTYKPIINDIIKFNYSKACFKFNK